MTYSVGSLIVPADFNGFIATNTSFLNRMWSTGDGTYGYGQTAVTTVNTGDIVTATGFWRSLINNINTMSAHQGTTLPTAVTTVATGDLVAVINGINADLVALDNNRLTAANFGSTSTTSSTSGSWNNFVQFVGTVTFASADHARWFFNAGGQLGVSASHPTDGNVINNLMNNICSNLGTVWMSGQSQTIGGTAWSPNMKAGGAGGPSDWSNTGMGYNNISGGWTTILHQTSSTFADTRRSTFHWGVTYNYGADYQPSTYAEVAVAGGGATVQFRLILDEVPDNRTASATTMFLTVRSPSTTNLAASWGTPSVSISVSSA
jgi:hypothetical protein